MSAEHDRASRIIGETRPKRKLVQGVDNAAMRFVSWFSENAAIAATKEFHPDFADDIVRASKDGFILAFEAGPHTAWYDAVLLSYVSRIGIGIANEHFPPDKQIRGAVMPFAKTLKTGGQGGLLDFMFQANLPILTRNKIYPIYTATDNDQAKRGLDGNQGEYIADNLAMMRDGFTAMAALPEGTVEAGRIGPDGKRNGMQRIKEGACLSAVLLAKKLRRPGVLFVPIGIVDGWKINDPNRKWPTLEGFKAGLLMDRGINRVTVGKPIRSDSIEAQALIQSRDKVGLDSLIGGAIASLVPEDMRGKYRDFVKAA